MIDSTSSRVHQHASGPVGGQLAQAMGRSKAKPLLKAYLRAGSDAIMDKGYDSDAIRAYVNQLGGVAVIALHPSRSQKPTFDEHLYRERHRIENLFARPKHYRRIATRYEKLHATFAAMLSLACILVWLKL